MPQSKDMASKPSRQARRRARIAQAGGRELSGVMLSQPAAVALEKLQAEHGSIREAIEAALILAAARSKTI